MDTRSTSNLAVDLSIISYAECLKLQKKLVLLRKTGVIGDILLFLEHDPPVYTIGRKSDPANWPGIDPVVTERGGDVTYHSRGQLVVYPILDLYRDGKVDVRSFVKKVERAVIRSLESFGIKTYVGEEPGIWLSRTGRKVASIGMAIDGNVSYHGVAINFSPEPLDGFSRINPCGLDPSVMGYVEVDRQELVKSLTRKFSNMFSPFTTVSREDLERIISGDNSAIAGKSILG